jgi:glycosyltransferase involved in cell wall biosynthesis
MKILSVIIPAYNEEATIVEVIRIIERMTLPDDFVTELIIVDDCSKDNTLDLVHEFAGIYGNIRTILHDENRGKSVSVREGIRTSRGDYIVIQDADLEYNPVDFVKMLEEALKNDLDFVYGNRFCEGNNILYYSYYWGNRFVTFVSNIFTFFRFRRYIPDMEVCYKLIRGSIAREVAAQLQSDSKFGFEAEITARLSRYSKDGGPLRFSIIPIQYFPRTRAEGKKIRWRDGMQAIFEILKYNLQIYK